MYLAYRFSTHLKDQRLQCREHVMEAHLGKRAPQSPTSYSGATIGRKPLYARKRGLLIQACVCMTASYSLPVMDTSFVTLACDSPFSLWSHSPSTAKITPQTLGLSHTKPLLVTLPLGYLLLIHVELTLMLSLRANAADHHT